MRFVWYFAISILLWSISAAAQFPCMKGGAQLADQRALRALRQASEATCPCASFSGTAARRSYLRCARQVLKEALQTSALRAECKRDATREIRGAACGSDRVACGRIRGNGRQTCRLARTAGGGVCADRPSFAENACGEQTHCTDVVDWTASTCVDPRRPGPYAAGARTIQMTKPSVVDPLQDRILDTIVWYPAPVGSAPISPGIGAVLNAPLDNSGGPYPVLLFSHGSCGFAHQARFLTALLASQGFVVIAPPHPGNTLNEFPTCGTLPAQVASAQERPQDIIFALDYMLDLASDSESDFHGALDPQKVAMSGHSFGGLTTYLVAAIEPRVKAALPFAAAVPGSAVLTMPSLTMLGQIDSVVSNAAIRNAYEAALPPKYLVEIENAGHYAWSVQCFPSSDCAPPATLTQPEAHDAVRRWVLPFLRIHLDGDDSFAAFFAREVPGFVVRSVP